MTKRPGLMKTPGSGRAGAKRHRPTLEGSAAERALTQPAIKRLARRAGVRRISGLVYEEVRGNLRTWLGGIIRAATAYAEHRRRMIVTLQDMLLGLKLHGVTLYGFEVTERRRRIVRRLEQEELQVAQAAVLQRQAAATAAKVVEEAARRDEGAGAEKAGPSSPDAAGSPGPLTPERALEIQASLADFRDSVQSEADPEVPLQRALEWVNAQLTAAKRAACSAVEFETVLTALERQNAVMLIQEEEGGAPRTLVFTA